MDATVADPLVGRLLDGRYAVRERLARGGMAVVYAGLDTRLDRPVAIKVMHPALAEDAEFVDRFHREARAAARLSCPYAVAVYDQGTDTDGAGGRAVFLVLELVRGRTLRQALHERGRLAPSEAADLIAPVLGALAAAHAAGLVHRDVKPENVLLADDGRVKVADFGLARAVEAAPVTAAGGVLLGTVGYLAPEQVATGAADARSDVYAAGVVLFEMLTGGPPFRGDTPLAVAYQHVHGRVPAPSSVRPDVPAALDRLVLRATARDPAARPEDGEAMLAELTRARAALPPPREPPVSQPRAMPPTRDTVKLPLPGGAVQDVWVPPAPPPPPGRGARWVPRWPRARRAALLVVVAVVVAAALTGGAGWWLGTAGRARVPTLVGLDRPAAEQAIARARLKVAYDPSTYSDTFAKDTVVSSTPRAGVPVGRGSTVRLRLSLGPQRPRVPRVAGLSESDARAALVQARLTVAGVSQAYDDTAAAGTVVRTDPAEGTVLDPGGAVSLVVSGGRAPVQVPDVADAAPEDATRRLEGAGLVVRRAEAHDPTDAGRVARTEPAAGTPVPRGSTVTMVVSLGEDLVTVPDVGDMSVRKARKLLESRGLAVRVVAVPGLDSRIVTTSPGAGAQVPRGSTVTIFAV